MIQLKHISIGVLYFIGLGLAAALITPFLGLVAGFLGAVQKLIRSLKNDIVRVKYHPMKVAKRRFDDAYYHARATGDSYAVKEKFRMDPLSFSKMTSHFIATFLIFATLLPFLMLYGMGKAPLRTLSYGIRFWQSRILKYPAERVYKNWGATHETLGLI